MTRLDALANKVDELYRKPKSGADPFIQWGYLNHLLVVAKFARDIAILKSANEEVCVAGALLHDIADTAMSRFHKNHEEKSLEMARTLLAETGFSGTEIAEIVNEVIVPHSCRDVLPTKLEGKVLATADALAHFETDFYLYFAWENLGGEDYLAFKKWTLQKIEKDFNRKIFFDDTREKTRPNYEAIKRMFSK